MDKLTQASGAVSINELRRGVAESKAPSSQRLYMAMLSRLEEYAGGGCIPFDRFDRGFVDGFAERLSAAGLKPSSARMMLKAFRAVSRRAFGPDRGDGFRAAFAGIDTAAGTVTKVADLNDVRRLAQARLEDCPALERARDTFLLSFFCGGADPEALKTRCGELMRSGMPQQRRILRRKGMAEFIAGLSAGRYSRLLEALSAHAGLRHPLVPGSAEAAFRDAAARLRGIPAGGREEAAAVAGMVMDIAPRWFAVRCREATPDVAAGRIRAAGVIDADETLETFVMPQTGGRDAKGHADGMMRSLLFFRCPADAAANVRDALGDGFYVYAQAGSRTPAPIPDREMLTFMLLCRAADGVVSALFPGCLAPEHGGMVGRRAVIVCGQLEGMECEVTKVAGDRFRVFVEMPVFGRGFRLSGCVPFAFLRFED